MCYARQRTKPVHRHGKDRGPYDPHLADGETEAGRLGTLPTVSSISALSCPANPTPPRPRVKTNARLAGPSPRSRDSATPLLIQVTCQSCPVFPKRPAPPWVGAAAWRHSGVGAVEGRASPVL